MIRPSLTFGFLAGLTFVFAEAWAQRPDVVLEPEHQHETDAEPLDDVTERPGRDVGPPAHEDRGPGQGHGGNNGHGPGGEHPHGLSVALEHLPEWLDVIPGTPAKKTCGDLGFCSAGSYCESPTCSGPVCYTADSAMSILMCGGVAEPCDGVPYCSGPLYCDDLGCQEAETPQSVFLCSGTFTEGCGIGSCTPKGYCDDCGCYEDDTEVYALLCGCHKPTCDVPLGSTNGECVGASYCDDNLCYGVNAELSQNCCPVSETFQKVYTPGSYDHTTAGLNTVDGGYIAVGFWSKVWRTDRRGDVLWSHSYDAGEFWAVAEVSGGFVVAGETNIIGIDDQGILLWAKELPGRAYGVEETPGGSLLVVGTIGSNAYVLSLQSDGTLIWRHTLDAGGTETARDVVHTPTGFLVLGDTNGMGAGGSDLFVAEFDTAGGFLSLSTLGGTGNEGGHIYTMVRMLGTEDGGFLLANSTTSFAGGHGILVIKLDAAASVVWSKKFTTGGTAIASGVDERFYSYVVVGEAMKTSGVPELYAMSLSKSGDLQWARSYGPDTYLNYLDGGAADDGGVYILTEAHGPPAPGDHYFYMLKLDREGYSPGCCEDSDLAVSESSPLIAAVLQGGVTVTSTATPLADNTTAGISIEAMVEETVCQQEASYFCNGILEGPCLCEP